MKVFSHYCPQGFGNCYMLGSDGEETPRDALIIDPGDMDTTILNFIEGHQHTLKGILITHNHLNHVRGVRTLMHIYQTPIYAAQQNIFEYKTHIVCDGDAFNIGDFHIEVISVPGHSADSVVYKVDHFLFTGDALSAGMMGATPSPYGAMNQIAKIQNHIFTLRGDYLVFPGHGPPSTLGGERKNNVDIGRYLENKRKTEARWSCLDFLE
ncbi:MAG: MBL fold metallo-hydrolase [Spirochaetaceae bacterium]|jgi:glyoxylase-like metal-dependent hydrolase (beta-lactamase superfamily II)|nr:MBL fold metallo-hydrolase [Spirochaetaceae bacterium]